MSGDTGMQTIGQMPTPTDESGRLPAVLTGLVWTLWVVCIGIAGVQLWQDTSWTLTELVAVDGLTTVMWVTVTFFSGIIHSYSQRYMAGSETINRFFVRVFAFTLVVMMLVATNNFVLFGAVWLVMGLIMAELIGHADGWKQAQAAASVARKAFLASTTFLGVALLTLWLETGATTVSGISPAISNASTPTVLIATGGLLLAAMIQSALVPFHTWLLSSMTAPTPASALMHAGFVNAGGVLLVRFAPVVTVEPAFMLVVVLVGAASALFGKLLKAVQTDVKGELGCSTVGQMGFMIMQAGLGFFAAALTHLILHGFYKAYQFLSTGGQVAHESPGQSTESVSMGLVDAVVIGVTGLAGGGLFALLTGKGTKFDTGILLTLLVVLTVLHAARDIAGHASLPTPVRYGAVPLIALPAIVLYAAAYGAVTELIAGLPAVGSPAELTVIHGLVTVTFVLAYVVIETGVYKRSHRLYVTLINASEPPTEALLTSTEEYNEY
ncbi:proton-conducting transporter membrane subunit [Halovenus rubra]|uniref:Proton-conducting transporter membrane subunit n=2 Tax=Halovenus rubra TaxID=869890 RepID=A0ABD5X953_9EURY|nr:proton-conducting transporter membrane subunit [Halovenus rubra]